MIPATQEGRARHDLALCGWEHCADVGMAMPQGTHLRVTAFRKPVEKGFKLCFLLCDCTGECTPFFPETRTDEFLSTIRRDYLT